MPTSKTKSPQSKAQSTPSAVAKPALKVKPAKDLEPDSAQSGKVRGGQGGAGGIGPGMGKGGLIFSDRALKRDIDTINGAVALLRRTRA